MRDTTSASSKALLSLPRGQNSTAILVKIDSLSETDAIAAVKQLQTEYQIKHLDVVIANAGIADFLGKAKDTPVDAFLVHFKVNTVAPVLLFQATFPLLDVAAAPKFVVMSSAAGSISYQEKLPLEDAAYGGSKAAVNFISRRIHFEHPNITTFPMNPGWLQTDMGNNAATNHAGLAEAPTTLKEGIDGMIDKLDRATREKTSGTFVDYHGEEIGW